MSNRQIADILIQCFKRGNFLYLAGNGGSAALAQHFAAEMMCKFEYDRRPLPTIALSTDTSFITAQSNDYNFESIFGKQLLALGRPGDVFIGLTTSGKSKNILYANDIARSKKMIVIDFPREGTSTSNIQDNQQIAMHEICRVVEKSFI